VTRRDEREMSFHNELNRMTHLPSDRSSVSAILGKFLLIQISQKASFVIESFFLSILNVIYAVIININIEICLKRKKKKKMYSD